MPIESVRGGEGSDKLFVLRGWRKGKWPVAKLHLESVGKVHTACAVFMLQQLAGQVCL